MYNVHSNIYSLTQTTIKLCYIILFDISLSHLNLHEIAYFYLKTWLIMYCQSLKKCSLSVSFLEQEIMTMLSRHYEDGENQEQKQIALHYPKKTSTSNTTVKNESFFPINKV